MAEIGNFEKDNVGKAQVDKYNEELKKKKRLLGKTYNRVGREVILSLYTFENMRDTGTLPKKKDGYNFVDFTPLSQEEIDEITRKNQNGLNDIEDETEDVVVAKPKTTTPKASTKAKAPKASTKAKAPEVVAPVQTPEQTPASTTPVAPENTQTPEAPVVETTPVTQTPEQNKLAGDDPFA